MPNRSMAPKIERANKQRTEYALQSFFKEATAPKGDAQMINGRMVPRPDAPKVLGDMVDDYLSHRPIKRPSVQRIVRPVNKSAAVRAAFDHRNDLTYAQLRAIFGK